MAELVNWVSMKVKVLLPREQGNSVPTCWENGIQRHEAGHERDSEPGESGELWISSKGARDDICPFFVFVGRQGGNETLWVLSRWVLSGGTASPKAKPKLNRTAGNRNPSVWSVETGKQDCFLRPKYGTEAEGKGLSVLSRSSSAPPA
jgi:hypothetical protein